MKVFLFDEYGGLRRSVSADYENYHLELCRRFREKFHAVQTMAADIYVIQECEDSRRCKIVACASWTIEHQALWWGKDKNSGLGVFAAPHIRLVDNAWTSDGARFFGRVRMNGDFDLVGGLVKSRRQVQALSELCAANQTLCFSAGKQNV